MLRVENKADERRVGIILRLDRYFLNTLARVGQILSGPREIIINFILVTKEYRPLMIVAVHNLVNYFKNLNVIFNEILGVYESRIMKYVSFIDDIKDNYIILDVGGGTGEIGSYISSKYFINIIVLDINSRSLKDSLHKNITPIIADAQNIPFRNHIYDVVYSFSLLEHLPNPKKSVIEMCRVARNKIFIQLPNMEYFFEPHTRFPFLWIMPKKIKNDVMKKFNYYFNFSVTYKNVIKWFSLSKFYHYKFENIF